MKPPVVRVILVVLGLTAIGFGGPWAKRSIGYYSALRSYSRDLKPEMSRKQVEDYLEAKNVDYGRLADYGAYADVTLLGQEKTYLPFCPTDYISIVFHFTATEAHDPLAAYPSDTLKNITLFRTGDCV